MRHLARHWMAALVVLALWAAALLVPPAAHAEAMVLAGHRQQVMINLTGGLPGRWDSCRSVCVAGEKPENLLGPAPGRTRLAWRVPGDEAATRRLDNLEYDQQLFPSPDGAGVLLVSRETFGGIRLVHRYRMSLDGRTLHASLQVPAGARLEMQGGALLAGEPLAGLASVYSELRAVRVNAQGQETLAAEEGAGLSLPAGEWAGLRGRFWTVLVQADVPLAAAVSTPAPDAVHLALGHKAPEEAPVSGTVELRFHGGPVEADELAATAPELGNMLYAALWDWLRALTAGLRHLLDFWQGLVGNWGLAILLLSLSVKVLMWPLTWIAERWQAEVNRQQSLLAPELAAIKREWKGEEAHNRTLEAYRRHGVSPFYTLKSLAGFLVQIPVFIAAFDMLGENFDLAGAGFLWIGDLSLPDRIAALPVVIPFLGGHLNLLPLVMTAFAILAARLQEDASLAPELRGAQRLRLYGMAAVFLALLYAFPAGMVLYWTANNLLHLLKIGASMLLRRP